MSRLRESVDRALPLLEADLSADGTIAGLVAEGHARRSLDLSDLAPREQAELIATRSVTMVPPVETLETIIGKAAAEQRPLVVKFGIDPTAPDVHLGHAVPIILAGRFQRMGHRVVFIIGNVTAKIGDPSGRSSERPPLTDADIAANLRTYQQQVAPFIDFERADLRFNGEWLEEIRLPQLVEIASRIPVSMSLQREDFRTRLAEGQGLSLAEMLYSIVMALDSVAITADVELGGVDQLLNMQMCRKVMEVSGQRPELIIATALLEGTDGTGAKMSKSKGNYVGLSATPDEVYGLVMSIPDHLTEPYLKLITEWTDAELQVLAKRRDEGAAHPMDLKRLLAGDVVAALHGPDAAAAARREFTTRFSRRSFAELENVPTVSLAASGDEMVGAVVSRELGFQPSFKAVVRVAQQGGLRLVDGEDQTPLGEDALRKPLREVATAGLYLKVGRKIAQVTE